MPKNHRSYATHQTRGIVLYREKLCSEIRVLINNYFDEDSNNNFQSLAKVSNVNNNTIRRSYNSESSPDHVNLLKMTCALSKEKNISKVIETSPPIIQKYLKHYFQIVYEQGKTQLQNEKLDELSDPDKYIIYTLANLNCGITKEQVLKKLGTMVSKKIQELKEQELIFEDELGILTTSNENDIAFPLEFAKKQIPTLAKYYDPHKDDNFFFSIVENVDKETHLKCIELYSKFAQEIDTLVSNKDNAGKYPVFAIGITDTILREED